jgi:hypothetical protein
MITLGQAGHVIPDAASSGERNADTESDEREEPTDEEDPRRYPERTSWRAHRKLNAEKNDLRSSLDSFTVATNRMVSAPAKATIQQASAARGTRLRVKHDVRIAAITPRKRCGEPLGATAISALSS